MKRAALREGTEQSWAAPSLERKKAGSCVEQTEELIFGRVAALLYDGCRTQTCQLSRERPPAVQQLCGTVWRETLLATQESRKPKIKHERESRGASDVTLSSE